MGNGRICYFKLGFGYCEQIIYISDDGKLFEEEYNGVLLGIYGDLKCCQVSQQGRNVEGCIGVNVKFFELFVKVWFFELEVLIDVGKQVDKDGNLNLIFIVVRYWICDDVADVIGVEVCYDFVVYWQ